ncbi:MAG: fatty acid cis/trans isomerase, partial [Myxococcota bacterium]
MSGFLFFGCNDAGPDTDGGGPAGGKADTPESQGEPSIYAVGNRLSPPKTGDRYVDNVQPVIARNCVTCHGCGDAPCQLKLTSFEAVLRGSNEDDLYATRVFGIDREYDPMHLAYGRVLAEDGSIDYAKSEERWRDHDFYSIIKHATDSLLGRVLTEAHDVTTDFDQAYELSENLASRDFECSASDSPDGDVMVGRAMPLGLPALEQEGTDAIVSWLEDGAAGPSSEAHLAIAQPTNANAVRDWENFFNTAQADPRDKVVARYLYEHLFFAHLHLQRSPGEFYRLVRSRTKDGNIDEIVTERAFDLPEEDEYFYRLQKVTSVLVAKSHIPWKLDQDTMDRWKALFLDAEWTLEDNPHYEPDSDNPFGYFAAIPANLRYRFMIENSKHLVDGMVRGSVCTGSGATFAIRDRFWVWFMDPDSDVSALDTVAGEFTGGPRLGESSWFHLNPESANPIREVDYLDAYREQMQKQHPDGIGIEDLWDGDDGENPNAWLTVLRHQKSATVHNGPLAGQPETIWILGYSNFERLYYDLVV